MTGISAFEDLGSIGLGAPPPADPNRDQLGQADFLTLMIAQFRNQDPFEPMDNGDFLGQLAQFGTVNGIEDLNAAFSGLSDAIYSEQALQAANLVGHKVLARIDMAYLEDGGVLTGAIELASSASNVQIDITDASGQLVRTLDLGEQSAGLVRFEWDALTDKQEPVADGFYRVTARVIHGSQTEGAEVLLQATVDSVTLGRAGQGLILNLPGGGELSLNQVHRIL